MRCTCTAVHPGGLPCSGSAQDNQRSQAESEQGRAQSDFAEFEEIITVLAAEKLEMESTVRELMMRLEAATKHTQALADERTFLQEEKARVQAVEAGSAQTQWCALDRTGGLRRSNCSCIRSSLIFDVVPWVYVQVCRGGEDQRRR